mmetsp:Transcript_39625/g.110175  ORF Transcript_39625/g.110175 Transcript_39625/m.110175 type:complete len:217 (+) Transcript_39625:621-1271(+)
MPLRECFRSGGRGCCRRAWNGACGLYLHEGSRLCRPLRAHAQVRVDRVVEEQVIEEHAACALGTRELWPGLPTAAIAAVAAVHRCVVVHGILGAALVAGCAAPIVVLPAAVHVADPIIILRGRVASWRRRVAIVAQPYLTVTDIQPRGQGLVIRPKAALCHPPAAGLRARHERLLVEVDMARVKGWQGVEQPCIRLLAVGLGPRVDNGCKLGLVEP